TLAQGREKASGDEVRSRPGVAGMAVVPEPAVEIVVGGSALRGADAPAIENMPRLPARLGGDLVAALSHHERVWMGGPPSQLAMLERRLDAAEWAQPLQQGRNAQIAHVCKAVGILASDEVAIRGQGHHVAKRERRIAVDVLLLRRPQPTRGRQANR